MLLSLRQKKNLLSHYEVVKNLPMACGLSFVDWIKFYKDFPYILLSMADSPYKPANCGVKNV